jgi:5'-nucleotidase
MPPSKFSGLRTRGRFQMMASERPLILLINDDGFYSEGVNALYKELKEWGQVFIIAPDREKSASSFSLTLHHPLRVKSIQDNIYAVDGTPADCVYLAVQRILPRYPDILISGINHGPNLGQQDISYSGTVAGARQGAFLRILSLAVSLIPDKDGIFAFETSAKIIHAFAKKIVDSPLPKEIALNINIPPPPLKGIRLAKLGEKRYNPEVIENEDPRGRLYYWIGTGQVKAIGDEKSDVMIIKEGYITVTPLQNDATDSLSFESSLFSCILASVQDEIL